MRRLPDNVEQALADNHGIITLDVASGIGVSARSVQRYCKRELLVRLAKGAYASREAVESASPWEAFALKSTALVLSAGTDAYAAGWSAVAIAGLPTISPPPDSPHVVVDAENGNAACSKFGVVRPTHLPSRHRTVTQGIRTVTSERLVVDLARTAPRADALVVADAALASGATREELNAVADYQQVWRNITDARWVIKYADPYAETALESLGRLTCIEYGLAIPISNAWIDLGHVRYRPDHLLDTRWLIYEGDGSQKYDDRPDAGRVIAHQREREWQLREAGFAIGRYGWRLARYERRSLADRFRTLMATNPERAPCQWYRDARTYRS